ncbi:MAG: lysophospholipid acyltransferase family protein [Parvularculaceae bacterium]
MARLRGVLFLAALILTTLVMALVLWPSLLMGREASRRIAKLWARTALFLAWATAGVGMAVEGRGNLPRGPAIVAANHQSMWETLALYALLPRPIVVVKRELLRIPIFGAWLKAAGSIAIDRSAGPKALKRLVADARARAADGAQLVIFPEGTRAPAGASLPVQPGVAAIYAALDAPCVPALHDSGRYWRHPGPDKIPGKITLRFLEPIPPGSPRKEFARELQRLIDQERPDADRSEGHA